VKGDGCATLILYQDWRALRELVGNDAQHGMNLSPEIEARQKEMLSVGTSAIAKRLLYVQDNPVGLDIECLHLRPLHHRAAALPRQGPSFILRRFPFNGKSPFLPRQAAPLSNCFGRAFHRFGGAPWRHTC
jgi:hypothetical protein